MKEKKKSITMKDVALEAGVSVGTVSRFINNEKGIKEVTLKKVQQAIEKLSYVPDEYARGLKTNRSNIIALLIPTIWHPFFSEFAYHVEKELLKNQYKLLICNADKDSKNEIEYIKLLEKNKVDGILGITYSDIDKYVSSNLPFVSIDRHFSENVYCVTSENFHGGQLACRELVKRDCQNLAYISGVNKHLNETTERGRGFKAEAKQKNTNLYCLEMPEPLNQAEEQIRTFFEKHPQIDGIFTVNDFMALRVIKVLGELGKIPIEDYQIIGFDGLRPAFDQPYLLSTIVQQIAQMAQAAVELLLKLIREEKIDQNVISLPVHFFEGNTTKKL